MSNQLEKLVLAHRYLYYVLDDPIISDFEYDKLEREARASLPEDSPIQDVGSSLRSSYSEDIIKYAENLKIAAGY